MSSVSLALTWMLIHSLWIALALWLVTGLVTRFFKAASLVRLIKVAAMGLFAIVMLAVFVIQLSPDNIPLEAMAPLNEESIANTNGIEVFAQQIDFSVNSGSHIIPQLWLLGMVLGLFRWFFISKSVRRYRSTAIPCTNDIINDRFHQVSHRLSIGRKVSLMLSPLINSPMTTGVLKPIVYLPAGLVSGFSNDELDTIFTHELSHIKRHDYLVNLTLVVLETLFFFNPMVWLMARDLRKEMEFACDEQVLQYIDRLTYTRVLLQLQVAKAQPAVALAAKRGQSEFKERVDRIIGGHPSRPAHSYGLATAILACGFMLMSAFDLKQPEVTEAFTEVEEELVQDTLYTQKQDTSGVINLVWEKGQDTLYIEGATLILKSGERPKEIKLKRKHLPKPGESLVLRLITTDAHNKADDMMAEIYDELVKDEIIGPHKAKVTLMFQYSDILNGEASLGKHYEKYKAIFKKHFPVYDSFATTRVFRYKPD